MLPQMTKSKLLWVSDDLDLLVKQAKRESGLSESEIYRQGAKRLAEEIINAHKNGGDNGGDHARTDAA